MLLLNKDYLKVCDNLAQMKKLYSDREEYYLFQFLKQICINGADRKKYNFNGTKIAAAGNTIEVIFSNGERRKLNRAEYQNKPFKLFRTIAIRHRN